MDYNLLETFQTELRKILFDCMQHKVDIEYTYYKHLHTYNVIELNKIGVCGNIAPSGNFIDE
jgi:ribonucleotide reductase beta subunit family protein with ferritin-like domain